MKLYTENDVLSDDGDDSESDSDSDSSSYDSENNNENDSFPNTKNITNTNAIASKRKSIAKKSDMKRRQSHEIKSSLVSNLQVNAKATHLRQETDMNVIK